MHLVKSASFWVLLVAASVRNIAGYAIGAWLPTYFVREYGVSSAEFGLPVGFVVLCGGTMGSLIGGFVVDRYMYMQYLYVQCICSMCNGQRINDVQHFFFNYIP